VALITFFSGIVDPDDHIRLGGYPAPWSGMLGLRVEEFAPLPDGDTLALGGSMAEPGSTGRRWSEAVVAAGATTLLDFAAGPLAGAPAATESRYGRGAAYYLATLPDPVTLRAVIDAALATAQVPHLAGLPEGVEVVERGGHRFVVNHRDHPVDVDLAPPGPGSAPGPARRDLLSGAMYSSAFRLGPRHVVVLAPASSTPKAHPVPCPSDVSLRDEESGGHARQPTP
jgi:beta-galactosidase